MNLYPIFPEFKKIELKDKIIIEKFTQQSLPYNDFEFASLWTYDAESKNSYSFLYNNFVVKIQDFITGKLFYSFLGNNNLEKTVAALLRKSKEENLGNKLFLIPEENFNGSGKLNNSYSVNEDPDSFDYILSVDEVANLTGGKYYDKRNLVNRFTKNYPDHIVKQIDLSNEKSQEEMQELFVLWEQKKGKSQHKTEMEKRAISRLFELIKVQQILGIGVYVSEKLIGFSTYHITNNAYAIMSFQKADVSYSGIFSYLNHQVAKHLQILGIKYINYEQDLGIPGLKKSKRLWRPIFFLKKYIIEEK